jgi:hypothetical protein
VPHNKFDWLGRIKAVEREHSAARLAADRLLAAAGQEPTLFSDGELRVRDVRHMAERLEGTYIIRLFAEFETGLRSFWSSVRATDPPSKGLLEGTAGICHIPRDDLNDAHAVRDYRNALVHERDEATDPIPIALARGHLCRFFSYLPPEW